MTKFFSLRIKIIYFVALLGTLVSPSAIAVLPETSFRSCAKEIGEVLQQWGSNEDWKITLAEGGLRQHFSSTSRIGVWILLSSPDKDQLTLQRIENTSATVMKYVTGGCLPTISVLQKSPSSEEGPITSDSFLSKFVEENRNGAVYTWSPAMPYSIDGLSEILKAAESEHFKVLVVLDPAADIKVATKILQTKKMPLEYATKSKSVELNFRNAFEHFPSCLFFKSGKMKSLRIPGFATAQVYQKKYRELK